MRSSQRDLDLYNRDNGIADRVVQRFMKRNAERWAKRRLVLHPGGTNTTGQPKE